LLAETALKIEETKPNYSILLLQIVASNDLPKTTRLSGALYFKNFIRYNYVVSSQCASKPLGYSLKQA
jgi:exportin-2 (importin alpha re-exporter)